MGRGEVVTVLIPNIAFHVQGSDSWRRWARRRGQSSWEVRRAVYTGFLEWRKCMMMYGRLTATAGGRNVDIPRRRLW